MTTRTVHATYDEVWQARDAVSDLIEASVPPRLIEAEVLHQEHTESVPIYVGNRALRGAGIGLTFGILAGMFLRAAVLDGAVAPDFLMTLIGGPTPTATFTSVGLFAGLGTALGAVTGFVRSRVFMPVPDSQHVDAIRVDVGVRTPRGTRTALDVLARTPAKELHTSG